MKTSNNFAPKRAFGSFAPLLAFKTVNTCLDPVTATKNTGSYVTFTQNLPAQRTTYNHAYSLKFTKIKCLLLTAFELDTISYGPSFFPLRFMAQARAMHASGKKRGSVTHSAVQEHEVITISFISLGLK